MDTNQIIFRKATQKDIPQIMSLINTKWANYNSENHYTWMLFNAAIPVVTTGAFYKDKLIGMFTLHKRKLSNGYECGLASGLIIDDQWKGKGYFPILGNMAISTFKDLDLVCSLPNIIGKSALERSLEFKTVGKISTMILDSLEEPKGIDEEVSYAPVTMETQFTRMEKDNSYFMFETNHSYRLWRFALHSLYKYYVITFSSNEFVIVKVFKNSETGINYGDILDFECSLTNTERLKKIILSSCWVLQQKMGADLVTIWTNPNSLLCKVTKELGFTEADHNPFFCVRVLNSMLEHLYDYSSWHIVRADILPH